MQLCAQKKILLAGILLGLFFSSLDQTIVSTAMPKIIGDLGGLTIMTWVTTAYMLSSTVVVPIAGKFADLFGRKSIYLLGILFFSIGSIMCGCSDSMTQLILSRGFQGIGGGMMLPISMTIVGDIFPPQIRGKWQGVIGGVFTLSSIVGPCVGGWIVDHFSWHWIFFVNLPIGILAAIFISLGLKYENIVKEKVVIDYAGAITLILGTVSLLLGLNFGGQEFPWHSLQIILLFLSALTFISVFILVEHKSPEPILSLSFFKNRTFTVVNILGFLISMCMFGSILFLPLFLQGVVGLSAMDSGKTLIPLMLSTLCTNIFSGQFINKVRFRSVFMLGMSLVSLGFYLLSTMHVSIPLYVVIINIIVLGSGMGFIMPTLTTAIQNAFYSNKLGVATASTQFSRGIGAALGISLLGIIMNHQSSVYLRKDFFPIASGLPEFNAGILSEMLQKAHSNPQGFFNMLLSPDLVNQIPKSVYDSIMPQLKFILAESLQSVFLTASFIALIGVVVSYYLGDARIVPLSVTPTSEETINSSDLCGKKSLSKS